jgi:hypothetical protein
MFVFIDVETTGLDPYIADCSELGCIIVEKVDDKWKANPKKHFHKRLLIQNEENADEEALEIGHYSESLWHKTGVNAEYGFMEMN